MMTPDICKRRHQGNEQSQSAFKQIESTLPDWRRKVLDFIKSCGERGATNKEIAAHFGKGINEVSGRRSELLRSELIIETGQSRNRCGVVVAIEFASEALAKAA